MRLSALPPLGFLLIAACSAFSTPPPVRLYPGPPKAETETAFLRIADQTLGLRSINGTWWGELESEFKRDNPDVTVTRGWAFLPGEHAIEIKIGTVIGGVLGPRDLVHIARFTAEPGHRYSVRAIEQQLDGSASSRKWRNVAFEIVDLTTGESVARSKEKPEGS